MQLASVHVAWPLPVRQAFHIDDAVLELEQKMKEELDVATKGQIAINEDVKMTNDRFASR